MLSIPRAAMLLSAASLFFTAVSAQTASATGAKAITTLGCYSTGGDLQLQGSWTFQSSGYCQGKCMALNKPVMGTTQGSSCFCGDVIPALDKQVANSSCNMKCSGFDKEMCGGIGYWMIYLTGIDEVASLAPNSTSSTSSTTKASSISSTPMETVVVTASTTSNSASSSSTNKVGIAVGVVIGLLAVASLIGAGLFFWRQKKRRELEKEYQRNAAVKNFMGSKDKPIQDQRLDSSVFSHRRESIGSIADEMDFSRRILMVRNPDRDSKASSMA